MYRWASWIIKKAECQRIDAFAFWCYRRLEESLGQKGDQTSRSYRKSTLNIHQKDSCWTEAPILWPPEANSRLVRRKHPNAEKDWRQKEKRVAEDEMLQWRYWLIEHEFEQTLGDGEGKRSLACCSPWGHKELDMTWQLNNTNLSKWTSGQA